MVTELGHQLKCQYREEVHLDCELIVGPAGQEVRKANYLSPDLFKRG